MGQLEVKHEKESMSLVDRVAIVVEVYGAVCQLYLETLEHDSGDVKALWSKRIYRYVLLYVVDNAGRHDIDFGREGLIIDYLSFSSY